MNTATAITIGPPVMELSPSMGNGAIRKATIDGTVYTLTPRPGGRSWRVYDDQRTYRGEVSAVKHGPSGMYQPLANIAIFEGRARVLRHKWCRPCINEVVYRVPDREQAIWVAITALHHWQPGAFYPEVRIEAEHAEG